MLLHSDVTWQQILYTKNLLIGSSTTKLNNNIKFKVDHLNLFSMKFKNIKSVFTHSILNILIIFILAEGTYGKYVEGHLKTLDDWAFLARFCFLSGHGRYEYIIEYERRYGELQLLLYYDDKSQWPAVYKSGKTCKDKLNVLSLRDNQIVTLSSRPPHNLYSGCTLRSSKDSRSTATSTTTTESPLSKQTTTNTIESTYFDQFLSSTFNPIDALKVPKTTIEYDSTNTTEVNFSKQSNDTNNNFTSLIDVEELFDDASKNVSTNYRFNLR